MHCAFSPTQNHIWEFIHAVEYHSSSKKLVKENYIWYDTIFIKLKNKQN